MAIRLFCSENLRIRGLAAVLLASFILAPLSGESIHRHWPHEEGDLPVDERVEWGRLENGFRYVILPWDEPPERLSMRLVVEAGSLHETEEQRGLAHFLEHMAFNGTENFSAGEMVEYFQRLGMSFGADTNAHTWWKETVYKLELPHTQPSLLDDSFLLLRDYADRMLFGIDELESERGVILAEKRDRKTPQSQMFEDRLQFVFPDALIPERLPIGIEPVIRNAPREEFLEFYSRWYTADRMILVAVGAADAETLVPYIEKHFASMARSESRRPDPDLGRVTPREGVVARMYDDANLPSADVHLFSTIAIDPAPDTLENRRDELAISIANRIISRRLEVISRLEDAPFTAAGAYGYDWLEFARYAGAFATTQPDRWEEALEILAVEVRRALQHGFTRSEVAEFTARSRTALEQAAERAPTRRSRELADTIGRSLIDNFVFMDPAVERDLLLPILDALTPEEIHAALVESWADNGRMIYVSGNLGDRVRKLYLESLEQEVLPPDERADDVFAYTSFGETGVVVSSEHVEDLDLHRFIFENGTRVSVMPTPFESNTIHVSMRFGGGMLEVPFDRPGLKLITDAIYLEGGLGAHDKESIDRLMAGRTVSLGFSVDQEAFELGGTTNNADFEFQLQLLTAYLSDPAFRPEAERRLRRQLDTLYNQLRVSPQAVLQNQLARYITGGDPRFGFPAREEVERLGSDDVAQWIREPRQEGYLEVSIVGDIRDIDTVLSALARTVGALPERMATPPPLDDARKLTFPRNAPDQMFHFHSDLPQSFVLIHWPTVNMDDIGEVRRLSILASVLSDRLRVTVREELGEAYSPYSFHHSSQTFRDHGFVRAFVGADPAQAEFLADMVVRLGTELALEGADDDELLRAIEPQKSAIRQQRRDNGYWLNRVVADSHRYPEQLEWARSLETFWDTVTTEQVSSYASRFLQPEDAVRVFIAPAPRD